MVSLLDVSVRDMLMLFVALGDGDGPLLVCETVVDPIVVDWETLPVNDICRDGLQDCEDESIAAVTESECETVADDERDAFDFERDSRLV